MISILIAGFVGGLIRGLVGFIKHQYSYKNVVFRWSYFLGTSFISGITGLLITMSIGSLGFTVNGTFDPAMGFIVGYAGGDFIENVYKTIAKKNLFGKICKYYATEKNNLFFLYFSDNYCWHFCCPLLF